MTSNSMGQNPLGYTGINFFQNPVLITAERAPTSNDIYPIGTEWSDGSVNPPVIYTTTGNGVWNAGANAEATTTSFGIVELATLAELSAGNAPAGAIVPLANDVFTYVNSVAVAGAPIAQTGVTGITNLSTDAQAVAGTATVPGVTALAIQPSNLAAVFAAPPATGGTTPAAGAFTTLTASSTLGVTGLSTLSGSATVVTGATALNLGADAGTGAINVGTGAAARTVTLGNVTGATAVNINTGTGGFALATTGAGDIVLNSDDTVLIDADGVLELNSSAGVIGIGNDADANNINIGTGAAARVITVGNSTGATQVVLNGGTAGVNIAANAIAQPVVIGNQTGATQVTIDSGTGAINIGTAIAKTITIGNVTGATAVVINTGTGSFAVNTTGSGDILLNSDDTMLLDADGVLELNSSAGAISIGNDADAQAINVGTGAAARTITIGNITGATAVVVNSGTGASSWTTTNGAFTLATGTGAINIGADAAAKTITIGNTTGATALNLTAGSGGVNVATDLNLTSVATKITMNGGAATDFIGQATLVAGTVTVANTNIAAGDRIMVTRSALNLSPALGFLITTISAGASFTVASFDASGAAEIADVSSFDYVIFRQT